MAKNLITTHELAGSRVIGGKRGTKRIGKVRYFVFHPTEKRLVGFIVKRPDFLWMFHRKDIFVSIEGYDIVDGRIVIRDAPDASGASAYRALGVNPDQCIMWLGLPLMTDSGKNFGVVGNVIFSQGSGAVKSIESDSGATANALLGKREIPAKLIRGFRQGMGVALSQPDQKSQDDTAPMLGAILVSEKVSELDVEGGVAEKAGKATAVAVDKASKAGAKVSQKAGQAAKVTGKAINKGAYETGKQIGKTKGMFSSFKEEYKKARRDE